MAYLTVQTVENLPTVQETWVQSLGWENPLEKRIATHYSILAQRISWTKEKQLIIHINIYRYVYTCVRIHTYIPLLCQLTGLRTNNPSSNCHFYYLILISDILLQKNKLGHFRLITDPKTVLEDIQDEPGAFSIVRKEKWAQNKQTVDGKCQKEQKPIKRAHNAQSWTNLRQKIKQ